MSAAGRHAPRAAAVFLGVAIGAGGAYGEEAPGQEAPVEVTPIEVIGTTPLPSLGVPLNEVPGNVQSTKGEEIYRHEAPDLSNFMNRRLSGVHLNEVQANPFQPDITYRGFIASPLIGTPIGLSVYQDGVRVNEPFGDTVNWDLIPRSAIASIDVIPGSNPLFGLNTLGGALSVHTKSGVSSLGTQAEAYGGSFSRRAFEVEHGGSRDHFDWFVTGNAYNDDGWRPSSESRIRQVFGKFGWANATTEVHLSYTFADNNLNGVGPTPESQLETDRRAVYTVPDIIENNLNFVNLQGSRQLTADWLITANAYYRGNTIDTFNSDVGDDCAEFFDLNQCLSEEGDLLPAARNSATRSVEDGTGATLQASYSGKLWQRENRLTFGSSYDAARTHFNAREQPAAFVPTDGHFSTEATGDFSPTTNVIGENEYIGVFGTDTFSLNPWLHLTASTRWNRAQIQLTDQLGTALNGTHRFYRLNPAAGFTLDPLKALALHGPLQELTFYANYSEGFRVPTPVELTCASPGAPCSLPSSFVADPPLKPVVAKTWETGLRGRFNVALGWALALYRTELSNEILFSNVPGGTLSTGFFQNVPKTRRQGVELGLLGKWRKLDWYANYSLIDATYQFHGLLVNAIGTDEVTPGDRIPGIPQHLAKVGAEYELLPGWFLGGDLEYASSQYVRGDDTNQMPQVPSYTVVNLTTRYKLNKHLELRAWANNVFDTDYETFGVINRNFFTGQDERFLAPGAPIAGWVGVRAYLD